MTHSPLCTLDRLGIGVCDCESLVMVLDSPALADRENSCENSGVSVLTADQDDRTIRA